MYFIHISVYYSKFFIKNVKVALQLTNHRISFINSHCLRNEINQWQNLVNMRISMLFDKMSNSYMCINKITLCPSIGKESVIMHPILLKIYVDTLEMKRSPLNKVASCLNPYICIQSWFSGSSRRQIMPIHRNHMTSTLMSITVNLNNYEDQSFFVYKINGKLVILFDPKHITEETEGNIDIIFNETRYKRDPLLATIRS